MNGKQIRWVEVVVVGSSWAGVRGNATPVIAHLFFGVRKGIG